MRVQITDQTTMVFRVHYGQGYADCPTLDAARHLADLLENMDIGTIWLELLLES